MSVTSMARGSAFVVRWFESGASVAGAAKNVNDSAEKGAEI